MWELEKAGGKFDNFNSKQQKAIHELIDGLTEIPTKPNKDQYRVDNQSQYTKIVGRTYYNGEYALYAIQKGKIYEYGETNIYWEIVEEDMVAIENLLGVKREDIL